MSDASRVYRALAVDDDEKIVKLYAELLSPRGINVQVCTESTQVIPRLKAEPFDVILLDIRMPGIEGTDLLPLIKKVNPQVPAILVSAYCDPQHAGHYYALGAFDVVSKPFSCETLVETVQRAVTGEERIPLVLNGLSLHEARDQVYRKVILSALRRANWNQVKAAKLLGVSRYCLIRWIKRLNISY